MPQTTRITLDEIACLVEVIRRSLLWTGERIVLSELVAKLQALAAEQQEDRSDEPED